MGDKPDGADLERTESYQWPSGHLAHLTQPQQTALSKFKELSQEKGYYTPASADGKTPASHDDETMLRYLRARKFLPEQAFTQFKDTEDWRAANQLDELYETIDVGEYEATRRLYPQWTGRRDKRGIPFYVFEVGAVDAKAVSAYSHSKNDSTSKTSSAALQGNATPWKMLKLFALYENLCRFVLPLCSALPERTHGETPISQSANLVDLSGVGFGKIWGLRNHMSDASKLATAYYPETLDRIFVVGAPSFFPTIWQWAQKWFDPITVSKIFILTKENTTSTLAEHIDLSNVPKKYGGTLDWQFGDMPFLEPAIANSLRWKEDIKTTGKGGGESHRTFPIGPIKWQYDEDGDLVATAIGSEEGKKRERVIAGLHQESGVARLALSPGKHEAAKDIFHNTAALIPPTGAAAAADDEKQGKDSISNSNAKQPSGAAPAAAAAEKTSGAGAVMGATAGTAVAAAAAGEITRETSAATGTTTTRETTNDKNTTNNSSSNKQTENSSKVSEGDSRQGTSLTRYAQQNPTHAAGQVAQGTPAVKIDGQGDRQAVVDPHTVGQAPKVHPLPVPQEQAAGGAAEGQQQQEEEGEGKQEGKGVVEVAKEQVLGVAGSVMAAVGLGEKKDEGQKAEEGEKRKEDPEVDNMDGRNVEEFLRSQHMSKPASSA